MSVDINYQQLATSDIVYSWWCPRCQSCHSTPCCPYISDDELMSTARNGIPGICSVCGRPMWEHTMTMGEGHAT